MLSKRSVISLCQYLSLQNEGQLNLLFEKHGLPQMSYYGSSSGYREQELRDVLVTATPEQTAALLQEIVRTHNSFRSRVSPKYLHDEQWEDLIRCLELDGYRVADGERGRELVTADPTIAGSAPIEDDLTAELERSGLGDAPDVIRLTENSASEVRKSPPNYNGALSTARVALETLARAIAKARVGKYPGAFDETKWGSVITYLRQSAFLTLEEERGLVGVYRLLSPGAHKPVGLTESEMVRLGRTLAASVSYFLIKRYNAA